MTKTELCQYFTRFIDQNCDTKYVEMCMGNHSKDILKASGWRTVKMIKGGLSGSITLESNPVGYLIYAKSTLGEKRYKLNEIEAEVLLKKFHKLERGLVCEEFKELIIV